MVNSEEVSKVENIFFNRSIWLFLFLLVVVIPKFAFSVTPIDGLWKVHQINKDGTNYYGDLTIKQTGYSITGIAEWDNHTKSSIEGELVGDSIKFLATFSPNLKGEYIAILNSSKLKMVNGKTHNILVSDSGIWTAEKVVVAKKCVVDGFWDVHQTNANGQLYYGDLYINQIGDKISGQADWGNHSPGTLKGVVIGDSINFSVDYGGGLIGVYWAWFDSTGNKLIRGVSHNYRDNDSAVWVAEKTNRPTLGSGLLSKINLGMKTHYGKPGDTIIVPIYLTNFGNLSLAACQFSLMFDSNKVSFISTESDSGFGSSWSSQWNKVSSNCTKISLGGLIKPIQYGEGELLRCKFQIKTNASAGDFSDLILDSIRMDERPEISFSKTQGYIQIGKPQKILGDVDGNGLVDLEDAKKIFKQVVGLDTLKSISNRDIEDVSGDGQVTSYDASLIMQHCAGLLPILNPNAKGLTKKSAILGALSIEDPISLGSGVYEYHLKGSNIQGLKAGEFSVQLATNLISVDSVYSGLGVCKIERKVESDSLKISLATDDAVDQADTYLWIVRVHQNGNASALKIKSAYLNEGKIQGNFTSQALKPISAQSISPKNLNQSFVQLQIKGRQIQLFLSRNEKVTLQAFNSKGELVFAKSQIAEGTTITWVCNELPVGVYNYRIKLSSGENIKGFFTFIQ